MIKYQGIGEVEHLRKIARKTADCDNGSMEITDPSHEPFGVVSPYVPDAFSGVTGMFDPVPDVLRAELAPATWIVQEWTDYVLVFPDATHLRVGSTIWTPITSGVFRVQFENQLGLASIQPMAGMIALEKPLYVEVVAKKFESIDHSLAFMRDMLADLFARGKSLPFTLSAMTGRGVRDAARSPDDLFAFHFFRHHHDELIRAIQAIIGGPHRVLSQREEPVRIHEVKRIDNDAMLHMLRNAGRAGNPAASGQGTSVLQRLQPERVLQRIPEGTYDTPENRFILSASRRMYTAIDHIRKASWYRNPASPIGPHIKRNIDNVYNQLRHLVTDRRFIELEPAMSMPTASRVLERKDGYREMTLLWNAFHRVQEPIYAWIAKAIDLRDVATLYEFWLLFELIDAISQHTEVKPHLGDMTALAATKGAFITTFPGVGRLIYQATFSGSRVYSGIMLKPDYEWETLDGRRIVMDAKFRIQYPWPDPDALDEKNFQDSKATTSDITKMHAYRDAIAGVTAAIVLYPGVNGFFGTPGGTRLSLDRLDGLLDSIVYGDLEGIGAIPVSPVRQSNE
jgi:predicted component of viral defense system (DUF524 family)